MRMRSAPAKLGLRCSSSMPGDARIADCEGWCVRDALNASALSSADEPVADSCKYCKCRGCRLCYGRRLPSWATSTLKGIHVACELFGLGVCNSTGNLSNVIRAISDAAYARWEFNHTRLWIDAVFATQYRREGRLYARHADAGHFPRLVASEDGLSLEEVALLQSGDAAAACLPHGQAVPSAGMPADSCGSARRPSAVREG